MSFILNPQPCAERWDAMTPANGGRHCATCQKTVIDFSQKTDVEILAFFRQVNSSTCGRFRVDQVGRPLAAHPAQPLRHWQQWLAGVLAITLTLAACDSIPTAPRPPLAHTRPSLIFDSASVSPNNALSGDTAFPTPLSTDSLITEHVLGFTVTPKSRPK